MPRHSRSKNVSKRLVEARKKKKDQQQSDIDESDEPLEDNQHDVNKQQSPTQQQQPDSQHQMQVSNKQHLNIDLQDERQQQPAILKQHIPNTNQQELQPQLPRQQIDPDHQHAPVQSSKQHHVHTQQTPRRQQPQPRRPAVKSSVSEVGRTRKVVLTHTEQRKQQQPFMNQIKMKILEDKYKLQLEPSYGDNTNRDLSTNPVSKMTTNDSNVKTTPKDTHADAEGPTGRNQQPQQAVPRHRPHQAPHPSHHVSRLDQYQLQQSRNLSDDQRESDSDKSNASSIKIRKRTRDKLKMQRVRDMRDRSSSKESVPAAMVRGSSVDNVVERSGSVLQHSNQEQSRKRSSTSNQRDCGDSIESMFNVAYLPVRKISKTGERYDVEVATKKKIPPPAVPHLQPRQQSGKSSVDIPVAQSDSSIMSSTSRSHDVSEKEAQRVKSKSSKSSAPPPSKKQRLQIPHPKSSANDRPDVTAKQAGSRGKSCVPPAPKRARTSGHPVSSDDKGSKKKKRDDGAIPVGDTPRVPASRRRTREKGNDDVSSLDIGKQKADKTGGKRKRVPSPSPSAHVNPTKDLSSSNPQILNCWRPRFASSSCLPSFANKNWCPYWKRLIAEKFKKKEDTRQYKREWDARKSTPVVQSAATPLQPDVQSAATPLQPDVQSAATPLQPHVPSGKSSYRSSAQLRQKGYDSRRNTLNPQKVRERQKRHYQRHPEVQRDRAKRRYHLGKFNFCRYFRDQYQRIAAVREKAKAMSIARWKTIKEDESKLQQHRESRKRQYNDMTPNSKSRRVRQAAQLTKKKLEDPTTRPAYLSRMKHRYARKNHRERQKRRDRYRLQITTGSNLNTSGWEDISIAKQQKYVIRRGVNTYRKMKPSEADMTRDDNFVAWCGESFISTYMSIFPISKCNAKYNIYRLVRSGLIIRRRKINRLIALLLKLRGKWNIIEGRALLEAYDDSVFVSEYGALQYHVATNEARYTDRDKYTYTTIDEAITQAEAASDVSYIVTSVVYDIINSVVKDEDNDLATYAPSDNDFFNVYTTMDSEELLADNVVGSLVSEVLRQSDGSTHASSDPKSSGVNSTRDVKWSVNEEDALDSSNSRGLQSFGFWRDKGRLCDMECYNGFPDKWGYTIHKAVDKLTSNIDFSTVVENVMDFGACDGCGLMSIEQCPLEESCTNMIKWMRIYLSYHFAGIRSFLVQIYDIRRMALWLMEFDTAVTGGHWGAFVEFVAAETKLLSSADSIGDGKESTASTSSYSVSMEVTAINKFGHLQEKFMNELRKFPTTPCPICDVLYESAQLIKLTQQRYNNIGDMDPTVAGFMADMKFPISICNSCNSSLKKGIIPRFSSLNNMDLEPLPKELQKLNFVEETLLALQKSFCNVCRLRPYKYAGPVTSLTRAMKGNVVHLPLPSSSINYANKVMPFTDSLHIIIDSLPTKNNVVWRNIVDTAKWYAAINKLKEINHYYKDVVIDPTIFNQVAAVTFDPQHVDESSCSERDDNDRLVNVNGNSGCQQEDETSGNKGNKGEQVIDGGSNNVESESHSLSASQQYDSVIDAVAAGDNTTTLNVPTSVAIDPTSEAVVSANQNSKAVSCDKSDSMIEHIPSGEVMSHYSVMPHDVTLPNKKDTELFRMRHVTADPVSDSDPNREPKSFPLIFPTGTRHLKYDRPIQMFPTEYYNARFRNKDPRCRRSPSYLFASSNDKMKNYLKSGIYATTHLHSLHGQKLTAGRLTKLIQEDDPQFNANLYTMLAKIPGTKEYWSTNASNMNFMDMKLGPCTFFITLSCREYKTMDYREFMRAMNSDIVDENPDVSTASLCANDPVSVAWHFARRFKHFLKHVIMAEDGPLGKKVKHFAWRLEYQSRGAPHIHMKVWCEGAPLIGEATDQEVIDYIDSVITSVIPDKDIDPNLHKLVHEVQMHTCGNTCLRHAFDKQKIGSNVCSTRKITRCRFGFPRASAEKTYLNDMTTVIKSRASNKKMQKLYTLKCDENAKRVNHYNPFMLMCWDANMDIQYVGEKSLVLNRYISSYITKAEKTNGELHWKSLNNPTIYGKLMSYGLKVIGSREINANEAGASMLQLGSFGCNVEFQYLNVRESKFRRKAIMPFKELEKLPDDSEQVFQMNWIDDKYPSRPASETFSNMCLYDYVSDYNCVLINATNAKKLESKPRACRGRYALVKHSRSLIVTYPQFKAKNSKFSEAYFYSMLMLFVPWRDEHELLFEQSSYEEAFRICAANPAFEAMVKTSEARQALEDALEVAKQLEKESETEGTDIDTQQDDADELYNLAVAGREDFFKSMVAKASVSDLEVCVNRLNCVQTFALKTVMESIRHKRGHPVDCGCTKSIVNGLFFVSGVGGTGKSELIKTLAMVVCNEFGDKSVLIGAPTGMAALNINGQTLHKRFTLPVQHGKYDPFYALKTHAVKKFRALYRDVKLLIIDEISMVSNIALMNVNLRCEQLFGDSELFGGLTVVALGDLLQLPPVKSEFCFKPLSNFTISKVYSAPSLKLQLWNKFSYIELTENMRQKAVLFSQLLDHSRLGSLTEDDIDILKGRMVYYDTVTNEYVVGKPGCPNQLPLSFDQYIEFFYQLYMKDEKILCLLSKNDDVNYFNDEMLKRLGGDIVHLIASDSQEYISGKARVSKEQRHVKRGGKVKKKSLKTSDTGGISDDIKVALNCRVMMRRNQDAKAGIVNGAIGTLRQILYDNHMNPEYLMVQFDGHSDLTRIAREKLEFFISEKISVTRVQFPISLAYAITIHKAQGLTVDSVLLDIGADCFESAMGYVVLSRCRNLDKLYFMRFDPGRLYCERDCVIEYNSLRKKQINPDQKLPQIVNINLSAMAKSAFRSDTFLKSSIVQQASECKRKKVVAKTVPKVVEILNPLPPKIQLLHSAAFDKTTLYPKFDNNNLDCFANAAVQCMFDVDNDFWNLLYANKTGYLVAEELMKLKQKSVLPNQPNLDVSVLRRCVKIIRNFDCVDGPTDSAEFLDQMLKSLPPAATELFRFNLSRNLICERCLGLNEVVDVYDLPSLVVPPHPDETTSVETETINFSDFVKIDACVGCRRFCLCCNQVTDMKWSRIIQITDRLKYLVVELSTILLNKESSRFHLKLPRSGLKFGEPETQFYPISAVQFIPMPNIDHFIAYRRHSTGMSKRNSSSGTPDGYDKDINTIVRLLTRTHTQYKSTAGLSIDHVLKIVDAGDVVSHKIATLEVLKKSTGSLVALRDYIYSVIFMYQAKLSPEDQVKDEFQRINVIVELQESILSFSVSSNSHLWNGVTDMSKSTYVSQKRHAVGDNRCNCIAHDVDEDVIYVLYHLLNEVTVGDSIYVVVNMLLHDLLDKCCDED